MSGYLNQQKTLYRDLGRRKGQSESVPNPKSDLDLFARIRIDKGPDFDEAEAARAIGCLPGSASPSANARARPTALPS